MSDVKLDCSRVNFDIELIKQVFDDNGIMPKSQFCKAFHEVTVHVRSERIWFEDWGTNPEDGKTLIKMKLSGLYTQRIITLPQIGWGFPHELLHDLDYQMRVNPVDDAMHKGWDTNGFNKAADVDYIKDALPFWIGDDNGE